ncbi:hypothetical protein HPB51_006990 [Rhipicephalus microplus]|uniref:Uncharacterized protein n=1 Tax=Rhipicephalus microplus TaxID=6941 RepID=A0A9J6D8W6_RHIMP|nr:hypothetical protein HPB51_006990 [Rhipicephalus microplus]
MFVPTQREKDAEAVAVKIRWKTTNANRDVDFAAKATRPETENVMQSTGLLTLSRNASGNRGDKRRMKHSRLRRRQEENEIFKAESHYRQGQDFALLEGEARGRPRCRYRSRAHSRSRHTEPQPTCGARANTRPRFRSRSIVKTGPATMRALGNRLWGARAGRDCHYYREGGHEIFIQIQKRLVQLENDNARYMHVIKELREENAKLKQELARKDIIVQCAENTEEVQVGEKTASIPAKRRAIEVDPAQAGSKTQNSEDKIRKRQDRLKAQVEEGIKTLRKEIEEGKNTSKNEMEGMLSQLINAMQQITSTMQQIQLQLTALQMRVETVERRLPASNCGP